jgi:hypothetical protein
VYNQFIKGSVKINSGLTDSNNHHIDKNNVVSNVVNNRLNEALGIPTKRESKESGLFNFETVVKDILSVLTSAIGNAKENGE